MPAVTSLPLLCAMPSTPSLWMSEMDDISSSFFEVTKKKV
jgi:hypothetical protein